MSSREDWIFIHKMGCECPLGRVLGASLVVRHALRALTAEAVSSRNQLFSQGFCCRAGKEDGAGSSRRNPVDGPPTPDHTRPHTRTQTQSTCVCTRLFLSAPNILFACTDFIVRIANLPIAASIFFFYFSILVPYRDPKRMVSFISSSATTVCKGLQMMETSLFEVNSFVAFHSRSARAAVCTRMLKERIISPLALCGCPSVSPWLVLFLVSLWEKLIAVLCVDVGSSCKQGVSGSADENIHVFQILTSKVGQGLGC